MKFEEKNANKDDDYSMFDGSGVFTFESKLSPAYV